MENSIVPSCLYLLSKHMQVWNGTGMPSLRQHCQHQCIQLDHCIGIASLSAPLVLSWQKRCCPERDLTLNGRGLAWHSLIEFEDLR